MVSRTRLLVLKLVLISLILIRFLKMRLTELLEGDVKDKGKPRMAQML